jgi:hypothetical protein
VANPRVEVTEGTRALVLVAATAGGGQLVVAVDWVDIRQYKVLRAAVPLRGRSVPILFAAYRKWQITKSQNALEQDFFQLLKAMLPEGAQVVVIADRGLGRAGLACQLQKLGLSYILRICGKVTFLSHRYQGRLDELPLKPGGKRDLGFGAYRQHRPLRQRVLIYWKKKHKQPWLLATDLEWGWRQIVTVFAQCMMVEELFRDEKNIRYGWGLRQVSLCDAARLERLLLVLAFAYLLLLLLRLICTAQMSAAHWASAVGKKSKQVSAFLVGRLMLARTRFRLSQLLELLANLLTQIAEENWG